MSRINGDKARTAVEKRRRNAQRMKDRTKKAELQHPSGDKAKPASSKK
ncbi:MAG: hypothetical protein ACXVIJ_07760 [Thermoanaerobaculia bacterium]